jgi:hypothetical protein
MNDGLIICSDGKARQVNARGVSPALAFQEKKDLFGGLPAGLARTAAPPAAISCIFTHDRPPQRSGILPTSTKECNYGIRAGQTCRSNLLKFDQIQSNLLKFDRHRSHSCILSWTEGVVFTLITSNSFIIKVYSITNLIILILFHESYYFLLYL